MSTRSKGSRTFTTGEDLALYRLVTLDASGNVIYADADAHTDVIGATQEQGLVVNADGTTDSGTHQAVELLGGKTLLLEASAAISVLSRVCVAADGKVAAAVSGERSFGIALNSATGSGSIIEVLPNAVDDEGLLLTLGGTVPDNTFVKLNSSGAVVVAGAGDDNAVIGSVRIGGDSSEVVRVIPLVGNVHYVKASENITAETLKCAANGEVQDNGATSTEPVIAFALASASSGAVARVLGCAYHVRNLS